MICYALDGDNEFRSTCVYSTRNVLLNILVIKSNFLRPEISALYSKMRQNGNSLQKQTSMTLCLVFSFYSFWLWSTYKLFSSILLQGQCCGKYGQKINIFSKPAIFHLHFKHNSIQISVKWWRECWLYNLWTNDNFSSVCDEIKYTLLPLS
jgi:hypothetical protein